MQLGRYTLDEILGEGGFGQVWRGTLTGEMGFTKSVAIKILNPDIAQEAQEGQSLLNEALIGARLKHRNIVEVHEFTRLDDQLIMVMELVEGKTLAEMIEAHPNGINPQRVRKLMTQMAEGLAYAHGMTDSDGQSLRLVHRDLKPSNVMITKDGTVKICDFGIALSSLAERKTATGIVRGTASYMSPEQVRQLPITSATDIWALGAIGFEMLAGRRLVTGSDPRSIVLQIPALVPEAAAAEVEPICAELSAVIGACLHQNSARRPTSEALTRALQAEQITTDSIDTLLMSGDNRSTTAVDSSLFSDTTYPVHAQTQQDNATPDAASPHPTKRPFWMRPPVLVGVVGVVAMGIMLAEGVQESGETTPATQASETVPLAANDKPLVSQAQYGGTLRIGVDARVNEPFNLYSLVGNTPSRVVERLVVERLMKSDGLEIIPHLLEQLDVSDDGLTLSLTLRDGVRFHPHACLSKTTSTPATAQDLRSSIEQALLHKTVLLPVRKNDGAFAIDITGKRTLTVHLEEPSVYAVKALQNIPLLPAAVVDCDPPTETRHPVSTGPFRFSSVSKTGTAEVVRFDDYWHKDKTGGRLPYVDRVQVIPYGAINEVLSDIRNGVLHLVYASRNALSPYLANIDGPRPSLSADYSHKKIKVGLRNRNPRTTAAFLCVVPIPAKAGLMINPVFRKAITQAVNRQAVVAAFHGHARPFGRYLLNDMLGYNPSLEGFTHDPGGAKKARDSVAQLFENSDEKLIIATSQSLTKAGLRMAKDLNEADIPTRIETIGENQFREVFEAGTVDAVLAVCPLSRHNDEFWGLIRDDGVLVFSEDSAKLIKQIPRTLDKRERGELYTALERRLLDQVEPFIPLALLSAEFQAGLALYNSSIAPAFDPLTGVMQSSVDSMYIKHEDTPQ